ncbi:MAG TPA: HD domain-containing phosphohydrolase [Steroidobacteraceae bacterium]|nr:HD domain-containing phosphohydrolase [Steroidobacteraceae bacterium]
MNATSLARAKALAVPVPTAHLPLAYLAARMTDGIVILDAQGRLQFCNAAFGRLLDRPVDGLYQSALADLLDGASKQRFGAAWQDRHRGGADPYQLTWLRADGAAVPTRVLPSPLFDPAGNFNGAIAIVVDAAAPTQAKEDLAVAKFILEQSSIVFYRARLHEGLQIDYVFGDVAHYDYSIQQIRSGARKFEDIVHADDRQRVLGEKAGQVAQGHRDFVQRYRVWTGRGQLLWVEDHTYVRDVAGATAIHLEGVITDVTERHLAQHRLHKSLTQTIGAIAATIDKRDPYTAGHQRRVAELSRAIAARLGLTTEQAEGVYLGALVHDVGKIAIPAEILSRPGRLSAEEFALVKTHVQAGVDVLRDVAFPWPIAQMVAQHHERLDGSGYPAGLAGGAIRIEARIIAVADVFESMSTHRPYRPALLVDAALDELARGRSITFDAQVVDACTAIVRAHPAGADALWSSLEKAAATVAA